MAKAAFGIAGLAATLLVSGCAGGPGSPLTRAAERGDLAAIGSLIDGGVPVDAREPGGLTPLMWAARGGSVEAVSLLITCGAALEAEGGINAWTPLQHALHKGSTAAALVLLDGGAAAKGASGERSLRLAAGYGNADVVRALLARGADPRPPDPRGRTALTEAVGGAWDIDHPWPGCGPPTETVRALLEAAPDLTLPEGMWGRLALAKARGERCDAMLALLESSGRSAAKL